MQKIMWGMEKIFGGGEKASADDPRKKGSKNLVKAAALGAAIAAGSVMAADKAPETIDNPSADQTAQLHPKKADLGGQYDEITGGKTLEELRAEIGQENARASQHNKAVKAQKGDTPDATVAMGEDE